jgi:hypothetical protein
MGDFDSRLPIKGNAIYNALDNLDPNQTSMILFDRGATINDTSLTGNARWTGAAPSADALNPTTIIAGDMNSFLMGWNGTAWDRITVESGAMNVNLDGFYVALSNPTPDTVGAIFFQRAATPAITDQTFRVTGGAASSDAVVAANVHGLDVNSFLMGYNGTTWDRLNSLAGQLEIHSLGAYNVSTNPNPDSMGLIAHARAASPADTDLTQRLTAVTSTTPTNTVHALDVAIHDGAGNDWTITNPLPVTVTDPAGTDVHDYQTHANEAAAGTFNFDRPVTALKTLFLKQIQASASGKIKVELMVETGVGTGLYTSKGVWFSSTAGANVECTFAQPIQVAAGVKTRVAVTNKDNQPQDLYYFLEGSEI